MENNKKEIRFADPNNQPKEMEEKKVSLSMTAEVAAGTYSNLALISHSASEFVIDFAQTMPGIPSPAVRSRIILTPDNAKKILKALAENVASYEQQYGKIDDARANSGFGFTNHGEA